jgi:hypothetical protein
LPWISTQKGWITEAVIKGGQIRAKQGNTLVSTLRKEYGDNFAPGVRGDMKLENLLKKENAASLSDYLKRQRK